MKIIDLSTEIFGGMPKPPSAPEVEMRYVLEQSREAEQEKGFSNKLEQFTITTHVATHFDAPSHFSCDGKNIDSYPPSYFYMVPTLVLDIPRKEYEAIEVADIQAAERACGEIRQGDLVILNTGFYKAYFEDTYLKTPYLTEQSARYLAEKKVKMVGIDSFTVDDVRVRQKPAHVVLLKENGILIIECVDHLGDLPAHRFHSVCLPLKIRNGSGAFTRLIGVFEE